MRTSICAHQPFNAKATQTVVKEVRLVPTGNCYSIEVVYDASALNPIEKINLALSSGRALGVDLGIDNLAALVSSQPGFRPVLINGKTIKSINALYNKDCAKLRSCGKKAHLPAKSLKRKHRIKDALHKAARRIVDMSVEHQFGLIVIGLNQGWKQKLNIGKRNNQKFAHIPHSILIDMIRYKAQRLGIEVVVREESYTSKASALDRDPIPTRGEGTSPHAFSGKRVKRGLYRCTQGVINADVNGALNILRKELGDDRLACLTDGGCVYQPVRVSTHNVNSPRVHRTRRIATEAAYAASCVPKPISIA